MWCSSGPTASPTHWNSLAAVHFLDEPSTLLGIQLHDGFAGTVGRHPSRPVYRDLSLRVDAAVDGRVVVGNGPEDSVGNRAESTRVHSSLKLSTLCQDHSVTVSWIVPYSYTLDSSLWLVGRTSVFTAAMQLRPLCDYTSIYTGNSVFQK